MRLDANIFELFAERSALHPDRVAIVEEDGSTTTYGWLCDQACRVATYLTSVNVTPEQPIGVMMRRSPTTVAVLLGILKAGCAYVPLDLEDPVRRRQMVVLRAGVTLVLVDESLDQRSLAEWHGAADDAQPLDFVAVHTALAEAPSPVDQCADGGSTLAYILFTSGSTGVPKGVEIEQISVVNLLVSVGRLIGFDEHDCYLAAATLAFDISIAEVFMPLIHGGRLLLSDRTVWLSPTRLRDVVARFGVTIVQTAPTTWAVALDSLEPFPRLRVAISNAEALPVEIARQLVGIADNAWNLYGPTETTVWSTGYRLTDETIRPGAFTEAGMCIGQPLANQSVRVVGDDGRRVVTGHRGELYISGLGLARGYRDDPLLTRERFVHFADDPRRFYASGDEGGWSADGELLFYGRVDDQMKIRGNRVDPAEVEAELVEHPAISRAVVTWFDAVTGRGIVAAIVPATGSALTGTQVHRWLSARLPSAMVPSRYLFVSQVPRSSNGKLDRAAVRLIADQAADIPMEEQRPLTTTEQAVARVWSQVLQAGTIAPTDHFFSIGGDSLAAIMVHTQVEAEMDVRLEIQTVFEHPTLEEFATEVDRRRQLNAGRPASRGTAGDAGERPKRFQLRRRTASGKRSDAAGATLALASEQHEAQLLSPWSDDVEADTLTRLRTYVAPWQGHRHRPDSLIVTANLDGELPGLFWCLQGHRELASLAGHLGPEQPVHGMRSGHLLIDHHDPLARLPIVDRYVEEIDEVQPTGSLRLGGNCQAATIMHHVASRLAAQGREIEVLIMMEQSRVLPIDARVVMIFGTDSHLNPYLSPGADPDAHYRQAFPGGYSVAMISGAHGQYFDSPNIERLAGVLRGVLAGEGPA